MVKDLKKGKKSTAVAKRGPQTGAVQTGISGRGVARGARKAYGMARKTTPGKAIERYGIAAAGGAALVKADDWIKGSMDSAKENPTVATSLICLGVEMVAPKAGKNPMVQTALRDGAMVLFGARVVGPKVDEYSAKAKKAGEALTAPASPTSPASPAPGTPPASALPGATSNGLETGALEVGLIARAARRAAIRRGQSVPSDAQVVAGLETGVPLALLLKALERWKRGAKSDDEALTAVNGALDEALELEGIELAGLETGSLEKRMSRLARKSARREARQERRAEKKEARQEKRADKDMARLEQERSALEARMVEIDEALGTEGMDDLPFED